MYRPSFGQSSNKGNDPKSMDVGPGLFSLGNAGPSPPLRLALDLRRGKGGTSNDLELHDEALVNVVRPRPHDVGYIHFRVLLYALEDLLGEL